MEMFKISGGQIRQIEVLLNQCFYGMRPGWPAVASEQPPAGGSTRSDAP